MDITSWLGRRVAVYWPSDEAWFNGTVAEFDAARGEYLIEYEDGDSEWIDAGGMEEPTLVRRLPAEHDLPPGELLIADNYGDDSESKEQGNDGGERVEDGTRLAATEHAAMGSVEGVSPLVAPNVSHLAQAPGKPRQRESWSYAVDVRTSSQEQRVRDVDHELWELKAVDDPLARLSVHGYEDIGPIFAFPDVDEGFCDGVLSPGLLLGRGSSRVYEADYAQISDHGGDSAEEGEDRNQTAFDEAGGFMVEAEGKVGGDEEVALIEGTVRGASGLDSCQGPCYVKVLYAENSGPNVMFACKTAVHQTEVSVSADLNEPAWDRGSFRIELLAPCPGEPVRGAMLLAVFEVRPTDHRPRFVGQVVVSLEPAADDAAAGEGCIRGHKLFRTVDGAMPLCSRKGAQLANGELHLRMSMSLPLPRAIPLPPTAAPLKAEAKKLSARRSSHVQPASAGRVPAKGSQRVTTAPAMRPSVAYAQRRKALGAIKREKEQARIARDNKIMRERLKKTGQPYVVTAARKRDPPKQQVVRPCLKLEIAMRQAGEKEANTMSPPTERVRRLRQEIAELKESNKLLRAKGVKLQAQKRAQLKVLAALQRRRPSTARQANDAGAPAAGGSSPAPTAAHHPASLVPKPTQDDALAAMCVGIADSALEKLEASGSSIVAVYKDLMSRRKTRHSMVETYKGEYERAAAEVKAFSGKIEEAERARRSYSAGGIAGEQVVKGADGRRSEVAVLQERLTDLKVEIAALESAKSLELCNSDLGHQLHGLQASIHARRDALSEKRRALEAARFDTDSLRQRHAHFVDGGVYEKLTTSISALQLALNVLSKSREWETTVKKRVQLQPEDLLQSREVEEADTGYK